MRINPRHMITKDIERMSEASGKVQSSDRLVAVLYELLRDHISPGKLEAVVLDCEHSPQNVNFTNGWLANYAKDLAARITAETPAETSLE